MAFQVYFVANSLISARSNLGTVVQLQAEQTTERLYQGQTSRVTRSKLLRTKKLGELLVIKMQGGKILESFHCETNSISNMLVLGV